MNINHDNTERVLAVLATGVMHKVIAKYRGRDKRVIVHYYKSHFTYDKFPVVNADSWETARKDKELRLTMTEEDCDMLYKAVMDAVDGKLPSFELCELPPAWEVAHWAMSSKGRAHFETLDNVLVNNHQGLLQYLYSLLAEFDATHRPDARAEPPVVATHDEFVKYCSIAERSLMDMKDFCEQENETNFAARIDALYNYEA